MTELETEDDISVRVSICGFSLEKLRSYLGSKDLDLLGRLSLFFAERESELDAPNPITKLATAILDRALSQGTPFPDLVAEGDQHVLAAIALAQHDQDVTPTNSESWQASAFWDLAEQLGAEFEPEPRRLLGYFCDGRPLFGKLIDTERIYYGYLSLDEVKILKSELTDLEEHIKDWEDLATLEFVRDLSGWLGSIVEAEQDLWFYVS